MPGLKLLTKLEPQTCLKLAWRAAQDLGYSVPAFDECANRFTATKGNLLLSALTGPLSPHCQFKIAAAGYPDANEVTLERNNPWLISGVAGVSKVKQQAEELMQAIGCAIEKAGGTVLDRKEY